MKTATSIGGSAHIGTTAPNTSITVYLPRAWKQRIKVHCAEQGVTISDYALALMAADLGLK